VSQQLNKELRIETLSSFSKKNLRGSASNYWSAINSILKPTSSLVDAFEINGASVSSPLIIANHFRRFFDHKVLNLVENSESENFIVVPDLSPQEGVGELFNLNLFFSLDDGLLAIKQLKLKSSFGHDEIPTKVVKDLSVVIAQPLLWLFNTILLEGEIQCNK